MTIDIISTRWKRSQRREAMAQAAAAKRTKFQQQLDYEAEGARAYLEKGFARAQCPYDKETQSEAWNHWVYGNECAQGEQRILDRGVIHFFTTDMPAAEMDARFKDDNAGIPVAEAIKSGMWKPRYVKVDEQ
jgi:hypothetical protein